MKHLFLILGFEMEEEPYDPRELFADIALLITEARTPDQSKKGRVEGPHCPPVQGNRGHDCDRHKEQVTLTVLEFPATGEIAVITLKFKQRSSNMHLHNLLNTRNVSLVNSMSISYINRPDIDPFI